MRVNYLIFETSILEGRIKIWPPLCLYRWTLACWTDMGNKSCHRFKHLSNILGVPYFLKSSVSLNV